MYNTVISCAISGIEGLLIHVESDVSDGLPMFNMVGFLASEVREANERVRTALRNAGLSLPPKRITINLSPAYIRKEGSSFDLPIAISILAAMGYIPNDNLIDTLIVGELSLNGQVNAINGILPIVHFAQKQGIKTCILPFDNRFEGGVIQGVKVIGVKSLSETIEYLNNPELMEPTIISVDKLFEEIEFDNNEDFSQIKGQETMKRAMEIAVAGRHNILLSGSAGAGKSMIAKCVPSIMPNLTFEESIEITKIYSINGLLKPNQGLLTKRPFRSPHHTISPMALIGGGGRPKPGEVSLAHHGVLFLDELPEFNKNVIELLRQPLEDKKVTISRVNGSYTFPADTMLISAMNPCPCGNYPDMSRCSCREYERKRYLNKISKPVLDRIDICIDVVAVKYDELYTDSVTENSKTIKQRVAQCQKIQFNRYKSEGILFNGQLSNDGIKKYCNISYKDRDLLKQAFEQKNISARGSQRILKVARTIADLAQEEHIKREHLVEAIAYHVYEVGIGGK